MKNQKLSISWRIWALTWVIVLAAISSLIVYWATWQTDVLKNCSKHDSEPLCKADINWCYWYDKSCHDSEKTTELKISPFDEYKTKRIDNILSWEKWDQLMDLLNRVDELTVPVGAIMAFDSKDWCPDGWEEWHESDWRFLMWWVTDQIWDVWWKEKTRLTINEMPNHWHYLASNIGAWESDKWLDYALDSTIAYAHTSDDGAGNDKYILKWVYNIPNAWRSSSVWGWKEFSILNPYYKVIFCKKSDNVEPVNAACSSKIFECEQWTLKIGSEEGGGRLDYQSKWICRWENWGSDKYCIQCISPKYSIRNPWKQNQQCYLNWKCYVGTTRQQILQNRCDAWNKTDADKYETVQNWIRWNCEWIWSWASTDYCLLCNSGYPYLYKGNYSTIHNGPLSNRVCGSSTQNNWTYNTQKPVWYWNTVWVFHYVLSDRDNNKDFPRDLVDETYYLSID